MKSKDSHWTDWAGSWLKLGSGGQPQGGHLLKKRAKKNLTKAWSRAESLSMGSIPGSSWLALPSMELLFHKPGPKWQDPSILSVPHLRKIPPSWGEAEGKKKATTSWPHWDVAPAIGAVGKRREGIVLLLRMFLLSVVWELGGEKELFWFKYQTLTFLSKFSYLDALQYVFPYVLFAFRTISRVLNFFFSSFHFY